MLSFCSRKIKRKAVNLRYASWLFTNLPHLLCADFSIVSKLLKYHLIQKIRADVRDNLSLYLYIGYQSISLTECPSVRPSPVFFNEPIMGENGRKWLGKQSKYSKFVKTSSELSQNVPKCLKMSPIVQFRRIVVRTDLFFVTAFDIFVKLAVLDKVAHRSFWKFLNDWF